MKQRVYFSEALVARALSLSIGVRLGPPIGIQKGL